MENEKNKKKDSVKSAVLLFVIGVLVGAILSTSAFFVYAKTLDAGNNASGSSSQRMPGGTPPEMPSGENRGGTPREMPNNNTNSSQNNS